MANPPKILDERAPVGNLTRNIVLQAPNDATWQNQGFGIHIMVMRGSEAYLDGVEIKRGGQRGRIGRYPFHWHMMSYNGSQTLSDAVGQYIKNSSINESANRGIVIHGTNGTLVQNNVIYKVKGHAIFTEDASERRNTIDGNLVLHVRSPGTNHALKLHELNAFRRGSSGLWLSNPDNTVTNNHFADCEGTGAWLAFPVETFGASSQVLGDDGTPMYPRAIRFGVFDYNTAHSCKGSGIHNDDPELNEAGSTAGSPPQKDYESTIDGQDANYPYNTLRRFTIRGNAAWKNKGPGMWERATWVNNVEPVAADNRDFCFAGSGFEGVIAGALAVGESLNEGMNGNSHPYVHAAFASYHHTFQFVGNLIYNFPAEQDKISGAFSTGDYYLRPVEKGHWQSVGNVLINSHPGVRITAVEAYGANRVNANNPHFNLAGALWDPQGFWGPAENYFVFDEPFYTHSETKHIYPGHSVSLTGGVSVAGPFYGFDNFVLNGGSGTNEKQKMAIRVKRYNNQWQQVGSIELASASSAPSSLLLIMRDFAAHHNGHYELDFPDNAPPSRVRIEQISNFHTTQDQLIVGVEYKGSQNAEAKVSWDGGSLVYTEVSSLNALENSNGETYWQDAANNRVWVKFKGGRSYVPYDEYNFEDSLYQMLKLDVYSTGPNRSANPYALQAADFTCYPNPTKGELLIEVHSHAYIDMRLYNLAGQQLMQQRAETNVLKLSLGALASGMYILSVNGHKTRISKQ